MSKLKLSDLKEDTPVKLAIELPAQVHRDLIAYAGLLAQQEGGKLLDPGKLVTPMLIRFMATDRAFAKLRGTLDPTSGPLAPR